MNLFLAGFSYLEPLARCPGFWGKNDQKRISLKIIKNGLGRIKIITQMLHGDWQSQIHDSILVNAQTGKLFSFCLACQSEPFKSSLLCTFWQRANASDRQPCYFQTFTQNLVIFTLFSSLNFLQLMSFRFGIYNLFVSAWIGFKPRVS